MDKKELNRTYGEFNGWGTAHTQFNNIFSNQRAQNTRTQSQSVRKGYSHIDTLRKLRNQKLAPVNQQEVQTQTEEAKDVNQKIEQVAELMQSEVVQQPEPKCENEVKATVQTKEPVQEKKMRRSKSHRINYNRANLRLFRQAGKSKTNKFTIGLNHSPFTQPFVNCKKFYIVTKISNPNIVNSTKPRRKEVQITAPHQPRDNLMRRVSSRTPLDLAKVLSKLLNPNFKQVRAEELGQLKPLTMLQ